MVRVLLRRLDGTKLIVQNVEETDTIAVLKGKIQYQHGVAVAKQKLIWKEVALDDTVTVRQCGITYDAVVDIVVCSRYEIRVETASTTAINLWMAEGATFGQLRQKIAEADPHGFGEKYQILLFKGQQYRDTSHDSVTLQAMGFNLESTNTVSLTARVHGG